jgi:phage/plasmid-like protein (TIGR03299 family)
MTLDQQLKAAGLNWEVELSPIDYGQYNIDGYRNYTTSKQLAAYRSDSGMFIDTYGERRKPFQNREIVETFYKFCANNNLQLNYLGYLDEGRTVYAASKLPTEYNIDVRKVGDITESYLIMKESHCNGSGMVITLYMNRLVCTNGMTRPVCKNKIIHHIGGYEKQEQHVTSTLDDAINELHRYKEIANGLAEVSMTKEEATLHLINAFGDPSKEVEEQPRVIQTCLKLFLGQAKGSDYLSAYNTAYGLLESVKEYQSWHSPQRGGDNSVFNSLCYGSRAEKQNKMLNQLVSCYLT